MTQPIFVTGSGTEIGKTYVACAIIRGLLGAGASVEALKPVLSGFDPAAPEASDTGQLAKALGTPLTPERWERMTPWRFAEPISPHAAAQRAGTRLEIARIAAHCRAQAARTQAELLLCEGAGGLMAPLTDQETNLDLIKELGWPAILVGGTYLGAISHTLTAFAALRGMPLAAIVLSQSPEEPMPAGDTLRTIKGLMPLRQVFLMKRGEDAPFALIDLLMGAARG
jgi:dethiobiotin synthetase